MGKNQSASNLTNIIQYNNGNISFVSGSTTLMQISSSGAITITGVISGSTTLSSSFATTASYAVSATSASYSLNSTSASYALNATSASNSTLLANRDVAQFATTASNVYYGNQIVSASVLVSGSITATGQIVAQTINVQSVTSSIVYSSGSNVFGNRISDTQTFTGSMLISGSVNAVGAICTVGTVCAGSVCAPSHIGGTFSGTVIYGSSAICGGVISGSGALLTGALTGTSATFSTEITSCGSQGRFGGWATGAGYQGNALEVGVSGGSAVLIGYNRTTSVYIPVVIGGSTNQTTTIGGNTIVLQNNGVTALSIASTGAATFSNTVSVGNPTTWATLELKGFGTTQGGQIDFYGGATRYAVIAGEYESSTNGTLKLRTLKSGTITDVLTLTSGGNVLIGNDSSPLLEIANGGSTDILSGIRWSIGGARDNYGGIYSATSSANNNYISFYTKNSASAPSERMRITSGGDIAVGCTATRLSGGSTNSTFLTLTAKAAGANALLELNGTRANNGEYSSYVRFFNNSGATPIADIQAIRSSTDTTGDLAFATSGTERMRIENAYSVRFTSNNASAATFDLNYRFSTPDSARIRFSTTTAFNQNEPGELSFWTRANDAQGAGSITERMRITSGGSVVFQCSLNMCNGGAINMTIPSGTNGGSIRMACCTGPNEGDMFLTGGSGNIGILIAGSGRVGIGTTTPSYALQVNGPSNSNAAYFRAGGTSGFASVAFSGESGTALGVLATTAGCIFLGRANGTIGNQFGAEGDIMINCANGNVRMNSSLTIVGSLSKGSGSFRIKHPLLSKKCTHELVHSFIEGPNADLIYSGRTTLTSGIACINIDCAARMTQGTFEALNRCVRVFTTNESSWDQVRGKVIGNILVIESQNSESNDNISWMVIGERKDEHMLETEWTDEEGRVITEPEVKE